jgi:hypothetical protein
MCRTSEAQVVRALREIDPTLEFVKFAHHRDGGRVLNAQLGILPVQDTVSLGVRWDLAKSAALKVQFDRVALGAGSRGTFGNVQPDFQPGGIVRLVSAAVDFLF